VERRIGEIARGVAATYGAEAEVIYRRGYPPTVNHAAEAMFAAEAGSLSWDEVSDALGELTNMVGGNIKGLLPAPSTLSIPSVAGGESYTLRVPGAVLASRVLLTGPAGPVRISLWRS
jgi:chemotaxis protein CheX